MSDAGIGTYSYSSFMLAILCYDGCSVCGVCALENSSLFLSCTLHKQVSLGNTGIACYTSICKMLCYNT